MRTPRIQKCLRIGALGSMCLVLASNLYDESDYYRNYKDFQKAIGNV